MSLSIGTASGNVDAMMMQLNKGVSASKFTAKVDTVLKDGKITAQEFKELAKDVKGGEKTLLEALEKISPKFDRDFLKSTELPTGQTTETQISKDDLAKILKNVTSGKPQDLTPNRKEIASLKDEINLFKAESEGEPLSPQSSGGKLLGAIEMIHGSIVESTKGGLEGKDKLASQSKDILGIGKSSSVKPEVVDVTSTFEVAKSTASMGSCVATFASTIIAIKEAVHDGANVSDLNAVKDKLIAKLKTTPPPSVEQRAEIKAKIGAIDESIKIINHSQGGNITEAIGQAINTAGGLMEFSKAVAPHLSDTVGVVGNGISAFSGIVTGVATTIKESTRVHENRKLKSRAAEFIKNPAQAMLKDKEKEAKTMVEDIKALKSFKEPFISEKKDLTKKLKEANDLPDTNPDKATKISQLTLKITQVNSELGKLDSKIEARQDKIDSFRRDPSLNKEYKKDLESQVKTLKDEKQLLDTPITGKKAKIDAKVSTLNTKKLELDGKTPTLASKKTVLETTKSDLGLEKTTLEMKKSDLEREKVNLKSALQVAKNLPSTDPTKITHIADLEQQIRSKSTQIDHASNNLSAKIEQISSVDSKLSGVEKEINTNNSELRKNTSELSIAKKEQTQINTRISEINDEIGDDSKGLTKKIKDTDAKIGTTLTRDPEIENLSKLATEYKTALPARKEEINKELGISKSIEDIGTQVVKRRSVGHAALGVTKGLLATAGGVAATIGAIAGTTLLMATPVGWALAGAAALIGIGMLGYKVYKTVQRNKTEKNLENQSQELSSMKNDLTQKLGAEADPTKQLKIKEKIKTVEGFQSRVDSMLLKKSPKAAQENILKVLSKDTSAMVDPEKTTTIKEKDTMKKFVQHVFKIDPDSLIPPTDPKIQTGMKKILERKMPMFA